MSHLSTSIFTEKEIAGLKNLEEKRDQLEAKLDLEGDLSNDEKIELMALTDTITNIIFLAGERNIK